MNLKLDEPLSNLAYKFNMRPYTEVELKSRVLVMDKLERRVSGGALQVVHCLNPGYAAHLGIPRAPHPALEPKCDNLLSKFAFNCSSLRHYTVGSRRR